MKTISAMTSRAPEDMTGDERLQEVAAILAAAILRLSERGLTGLPPASKHSCDTPEKWRRA